MHKVTAAILVVLALSMSPAFGESRNCTDAERAEGDKQIWLSPKDKQYYLQFHLPWGQPKATSASPDELLLIHRDYVISYDKVLLVPMWTAHKLDPTKLDPKLDRINCFRQDPRVNPAAISAMPNDYDEPIFDQGHLSPNGDMSTSATAVVNSFVMTNMTPQYCQFNRGVWQILESSIRIWAKQRGTVYITTGSVFDWDKNGVADAKADVRRMKSKNKKNRVAVPSHFYKIVVHQMADGTIESLAFLLPNDQTDLDGQEAVDYLTSHLVSIDEIEAVTGLNLFSQVSQTNAAAEKRVERAKASALWSYPGAIPKSLTHAPQCKKTLGKDPDLH